MAERSGRGEPDDLDPLLLDTTLRANAARAAAGLTASVALPVAAVVGASSRYWSWTAVAATTATAVLVARYVSRRSARIDHELAAMVDEP
jgi:hypothetical protein